MPSGSVLGLIPARGGSRGVPRKNVRELGGRPLIAWTAEAALGAECLDRVVLSTDDDEIAEVGRTAGIEVPFVRPAELAGDTTPMIDVVVHALETLEAMGASFEAVCLLQPTNPFRGAALIDAAVNRFFETSADSVFTTLVVPPEHNPHWVYLETADGSLRLATGEDTPIGRRQDLPPAFHREGSVYVSRVAMVFEDRSLYGARSVGIGVDPAASVNIDTAADWERAEKRIS